MAQVSNSSPTIRTLLLLPEHKHEHVHVTVSSSFPCPPSNPLNTATYCARPSFFGTEHVRIAHPGQLEDVTGPGGFYNYPSIDKRAQ